MMQKERNLSLGYKSEQTPACYVSNTLEACDFIPLNLILLQILNANPKILLREKLLQ